MLLQFGANYTLFRQDRKTNVRTEIAQVAFSLLRFCRHPSCSQSR